MGKGVLMIPSNRRVRRGGRDGKDVSTALDMTGEALDMMGDGLNKMEGCIAVKRLCSRHVNPL